MQVPRWRAAAVHRVRGSQVHADHVRRLAVPAERGRRRDRRVGARRSARRGDLLEHRRARAGESDARHRGRDHVRDLGARAGLSVRDHPRERWPVRHHDGRLRARDVPRRLRQRHERSDRHGRVASRRMQLRPRDSRGPHRWRHAALRRRGQRDPDVGNDGDPHRPRIHRRDRRHPRLRPRAVGRRDL